MESGKIKSVLSGSGVIEKLGACVKSLNGTKAFILADKNTFRAAGSAAINSLTAAKIGYTTFLFGDSRVKPDENAVGAAFMHYDKTCDAVVAIGSGVINDIGKMLSATAKTPYIVVATAPSMDGYASATSSIDRDGLKVSLPTKRADIIIGDTDILKNAPTEMLKAGLGDMLAKYVSVAEWRISHEITGEFYSEEIAKSVRAALKKCVDNAAGLLKREEKAVGAVFDGLIICGEAMAKAGLSRPASGVEHYFSHIWDMRGLEFGTATAFHGTQCAVATLYAAKLYGEILKIKPDRTLALKSAAEFDFNAWAKTLKGFLGRGADCMIAAETRDKKYDLNLHAKLLDVIIAKWDKILKIIKEEIPPASEIAAILDSVGLPKSRKELAIDGDISLTFKATKDIRDKYVCSRLCWDLGITDEIVRCIEE